MISKPKIFIKSAMAMSFCIFISRITGLGRELFIAYIFGVGLVSDVVNVAFKFPNLFRRIFGEGALSAVFVPMYSKKLLKDKNDAKDFASNIFIILLLVVCVVVIILQLLMPYIIYLIAPGFHENLYKFELTILLCRITIIYLIFISVSALFGGILNSIGRYIIFAFAPVILNSVIIIVTTFSSKYYSVETSISYSIVIGGILQVLFIYYFNIKYQVKVDLVKPYLNDSIKSFMKKILPAILSSGIIQINLFISQSVASFFPGAISVMAYADRIYQLPISLIGITIGTILLTEQSILYSKGDLKKFFAKQNDALSISSLIGLPSALGIIILAQEIIFTLYERGEFVKSDTIITAKILIIYCMGLPAFIYNKVLIQSFYASGDLRTPMNISIHSLFINIVLTLILAYFFKLEGLAAATSICSWITIFLQIFYLRRLHLLSIDKSTYFYIFQVLICSMLMLVGVQIIKYFFPFNIYLSNAAIYKILILGLMIFSGMLIYTITCMCCGLHKKMRNIVSLKKLN